MYSVHLKRFWRYDYFIGNRRYFDYISVNSKVLCYSVLQSYKTNQNFNPANFSANSYEKKQFYNIDFAWKKKVKKRKNRPNVIFIRNNFF